MGEELKPTKLQQVELIAKIIGSVSIPVIGIFATLLFNFHAEKNRQTQLFAEIMSRRESSDSDIRASMFNTLMDNYIGRLTATEEGTKQTKHNRIKELHKKVVFLKLLVNNFQEYFNAKPLFEDLYAEIEESLKTKNSNANDIRDLKAMKQKLIKIATSTSQKQEMMLARDGFTCTSYLEIEKVKCILLYSQEGLKVKNGDMLVDMEHQFEGACLDRAGYNTDKKPEQKETDRKDNNVMHYSLEIKMTEAHDHEVKVEITVYEDIYENSVYRYSKMKQDKIPFAVSYFDMPFMDNTRLFNGSRFSLMLKGIEGADWAKLGIISFREEFMSLRDRPFFEEMLNKLNRSG